MHPDRRAVPKWAAKRGVPCRTIVRGARTRVFVPTAVWLFRGEMWMEGLLDGACCEGKWVVAFPDGTEVAMSAAELQVSPDVVIEGATVDALRRTCP